MEDVTPTPAASPSTPRARRRNRPSNRRASVASTQGTGRNRQRASLACSNCRQRKIKCVFSDPATSVACTSCQEQQIACVMSGEDRRKASSHVHVAMLEERIRQLETLVKYGKDGDSNSFEEGGLVPDDALASFDRQLPDQSSSVALSNAQMDSDQLGIDYVHSGEQDLPRFQSLPEPNEVDAFSASSSHSVPGQSAIDSQSFTTKGATPMSQSNTCHLIADHVQGEASYYGPTCQLYIQWREQGSDDSLVPVDPTPYLTLDSDMLRKQLFETFWRTQPLSVPIVDRDLFEAGRQAGRRSNYYSTFLECCILGCATRLRTSGAIRALGSNYVELAKAEILNELERPNIASLQGFLLLSDLEATRGRDRLGYLYCGISCRLAVDFGLAQSCIHLVEKGKMTGSEAALRKRLFSGLVVYDKLWALYLGRTSAIPLATIAFASQQRSENEPGWSDALKAWVALCSLIGEITELFDGPYFDAGFLRKVAEVDARLSAQLASLPPSVALDHDRLSELDANTFGLHMQYCGTRIVLNRLLFNAATADALNHGDAHPQALASSDYLRKIMYDNAACIARLISIYQNLYGVENIITVMLDNTYIAAAVLISRVLAQLVESPDLPGDEIRLLQTVAEILSQAQAHYPVAARIRCALSRFVQDSPLAGMFGSWAEGKAPSDTKVVWNTDRKTSRKTPTLRRTQSEGSSFGQDLSLENFIDDDVFQDMDVDNLMGWAFT